MTVLVAVFWKRGMAIANLPVYIAHFSNSVKNGTNSAALWIFVFLLSPVIINMRKRENEYAITIVLGYIIFLFAIFLFRSDGSLGGGLPLSLNKVGDSGRRLIMQVMPTAVWLLAYCVGKADNSNGKP